MFKYNYNSSLRRYTVLMGALFNNIEVARERDGVTYLQKVPISNSSKENFVRKLETRTSEDGDNTFAKVETILPRMCLTMVDVNYNPVFKTNISNREMMSRLDGIKPKTTSQFNPVPFKIMYELSIFTRHHDDMFQIVEQILPYFQPNFSCKVTELHTNEIKFDRDIQVTIQSIAIDESVEGGKTDRRRLEWSIMFELDGWLYPPVKEISNEIRTIYLDFFANKQELKPEGNFESVDISPCPSPNIPKDEWNGKKKYGYSSDTPIPSGGEESGVRGIPSGCDKEMPI